MASGTRIREADYSAARNSTIAALTAVGFSNDDIWPAAGISMKRAFGYAERGSDAGVANRQSAQPLDVFSPKLSGDVSAHRQPAIDDRLADA